VRPLRAPASTWACRIHLRSVSDPTPSLGPKAWAAAHAEGYSPSHSSVSRVARSRCPARYLFAMIPILRKTRSGTKPGTVHSVLTCPLVRDVSVLGYRWLL
jgi:hypothetical protein